MKLDTLKIRAPMRRLTAEASDWDAVPAAELRWMFMLMLLIRRFEETLLDLKERELINGPVHTSIGQEATAAGVALALRGADKITGSHRAHHQYLAKVLCAVAPAGYDPLVAGLTPKMDDETRILLCEVMGLMEGCSSGRGGSMHLNHPAAGVAGTNAIVAGGVAHAAGVAWADAFQGRPDVTVSFLGDGAVYQGVLNEASNLAGIWKVPVIYFIENNQYAVATSRQRACSAPRLCEVAAAYDMPGIQTDGMDPLSVRLAVAEVIRRRGEGWLPCYIEAETYRYCHHAGQRPGSAFGYRTKEEEDAQRQRDPLALCRAHLRRRGLLSDADEHALREDVERCLRQAVDYATERDADADGAWRVRANLWPAVADLSRGLRDEAACMRGPFVEADRIACTREVKYAAAISEVTGRWLERDPLAFVLGEEVANFGGGAYGATKGLPARFPERVRNTPISEAGFCGLAAGAAMNGMHPIVEIMFGSFVLVAADQLFNQIGQLTHIYGGHVGMPLVVRTRVASGLGYGAQHSMDPVALFALFPGWRIFVPTTAFDYIGLFNAAMRSRSPTVIVEHHEFYNRAFAVPEADLDFVVQPGTASVRRVGRDVTVAAYGWMTALALEAAELLAADGIEAEVIDLRTLDSAGIDYATLGRSISKTGALAVVEQSPASLTVGARIAQECQRRYYDYFDGPPGLLAGPDVPLPVCGRLEKACLPTRDDVADLARRCARREIA
ncbi:MAG: thiamine pyrophosphate-dependent enzyme [Kiritimatiellae bacterium]|nr:thiamine pyrophosphate-dependent enzyme [Kiritimatiellia bacterium]